MYLIDRKKGGIVWIITDSPWGDTGKGRTVDFLTDEADAVVRWQGGSNSGHTVTVNGMEIDVHAIPSGLVRTLERDDIMSVMGRGMVIGLPGIFKEIAHLEEYGIKVTPENLLISSGIHLTLPYHRALEAAREDSSDNRGTTRQAISQTYGFIRMYEGIRVCEIVDLDHVRKRIQVPLGMTNAILKQFYSRRTVTENEVMAEIEEYRDRILEFVRDEVSYLNTLLEKGGRVVAEGAQSSMLDIDHGMYPYGTASRTWADSLQGGCGIHHGWVEDHYMVIKAYDTRVGNGPLVSQMNDTKTAIRNAEIIAERGKEFGVTSGRPRMIAYPDQVIAEYVARVGRPTKLVINKGDVLHGLGPMKLCIGYKNGDRIVNGLPTSILKLERCKPVLAETDGWDEEFRGATNMDDLPKATKAYYGKLSAPFARYGCKLSMIGTGPGREEMIVL